MTSRDFCYWLQGYFELTGKDNIREIPQWQIEKIRNHLAMVFKHEIDPSFGDKKHQDELTKIHDAIVAGTGPIKFNC